MKSPCYGVDWSRGFLAVTRSVRGMRGVRHSVVFTGTVPGNKDAIRIRDQLGQGQAGVAMALPVENSLLRLLTAPFPALRKARRVLSTLLDVQLPFPVEECIDRYPVVRKSGSRVQAVAVAARKETVGDYLRVLKAEGWDPIALDHEGLALWAQSLREEPCPPDTRRAVAYIGYDRVVLVWGTATTPEGAHSCRRDPDGLEEAGAAASRLAAKLRQVLHPLLQSGPQPEWCWCGPGAARSAFVQALEQAMGLAPAQRGRIHRETESFLARAIAQRWLDGSTREIDFRWSLSPHPQRLRRERTRQRGLFQAAMVCLLAACIGLAGWIDLLRRREREWDQALKALTAELAPGWSVPPHQEVLVAGRALEEQRRLAEPYLRLYSPELSLHLDALLRRAAERGILLDTIAMNSIQVTLAGRAEDRTAWAALEEILAAGGYALAPVEQAPCEHSGAQVFRQRGERTP